MRRRLVAAVGQVVALERPPEAAGLDADDRVELRVELRVASEDLGRDRVGLDPVGLPRERRPRRHRLRKPRLRSLASKCGEARMRVSSAANGASQTRLCVLSHSYRRHAAPSDYAGPLPSESCFARQHDSLGSEQAVERRERTSHNGNVLRRVAASGAQPRPVSDRGGAMADADIAQTGWPRRWHGFRRRRRRLRRLVAGRPGVSRDLRGIRAWRSRASRGSRRGRTPRSGRRSATTAR